MATRSPPLRKRDFAKRALGFADRALPGFPALWIAAAAAAVFMVVTGGFGSDALPLARSALLWTALIGWTVVKWQAWFLWRVRCPGDWLRTALIGACLLNLPLPLEIWVALRLVGIDQPLTPVQTWLEAAAISGLIVVIVIAATAKRHRPAGRTAPPSSTGTLARARVCPSILAAIEAEDHYCRRGSPMAARR